MAYVPGATFARWMRELGKPPPSSSHWIDVVHVESRNVRIVSKPVPTVSMVSEVTMTGSVMRCTFSGAVDEPHDGVELFMAPAVLPIDTGIATCASGSV